MTDVVLDASALMAFLHSEPGADKVAKVLGDAVVSAVNFSEVLKKTIGRGGSIDTVAPIFAGFPSQSYPLMKSRQLRSRIRLTVGQSDGLRVSCVAGDSVCRRGAEPAQSS